MLIFIVLIVFYIISSAIWFLSALGRKNKPGKWYDHVFAPGAFLMIFLYQRASNIFKK